MRNISREKCFELISSVRDLVEKEIDLPKYFEEGSSNINMELSEVDLQGVSNGYLSEIVYAITGYEVEVIGEVEELFPCPCCGLKTLTELYDKTAGTGYDICPYCEWQDDGTTDINSYRSINKGSIANYLNKLRINPNKYYKNKWLNGEGNDYQKDVSK
ncbi:CPCC family cysteine-rich protein [Paenibacillus sp. UMB7766-LJ446]|uniref:CPCC family cysteine-rich protein n=1 Tax=Paenibacillus sp. UMB7766-LJ446 TaxID=3046313 RepID=UPI00254A834C|nr:CPCC family cysteine-rich protein [Paenibacillus sp. UMB7766-LJ446]MDK8193128.1 CPCC family cysteine-rich protein [Paenibacillus sp. UMB7766-LJ446]